MNIIENNNEIDLFTASKKALIDRDILDKLCCLRVNGEVYQVFMVILLKTFGFGQNSNIIKNDEFIQLTGLRPQNICRSIRNLCNMQIIKKTKKSRFINVFEINKNVDKWRTFDTEKPAEIIKNDNEPLNQKNNTKINNFVENKQSEIIKNDNEPLKDDKNALKINANVENYVKAQELYYNKIINIINNNINNNYIKNILKIDLSIFISEKSLLKSDNVAKRICGYFNFKFFWKYKTQFKMNFGRDIAIINRIYATYGECKTLELINEFFNLTAEPGNWEYGKVSYTIFELSINKLIIRLAENEKNKQNTIYSIENKQKTQYIDKPKATVKFEVMMNDLKKQYGVIGAMAHIEEYKIAWKKQLQNFVNVCNIICRAKVDKK